MGMMDFLFISKDKLPISDDEKTLIADEHGFQTQTFDCVMNDFYVTNDDYLITKGYTYKFIPSKLNAKEFIPVFDAISEKIKPLNYSGIVNFYNPFGRTWFEFDATFKDGKLINIERVFNKKMKL